MLKIINSELVMYANFLITLIIAPDEISSYQYIWIFEIVEITAYTFFYLEV